MSRGLTSGTCNICGQTVTGADLFAHLRNQHGMDVEPVTWPDGDVVFVDNSLWPADFDLGGEG